MSSIASSVYIPTSIIIPPTTTVEPSITTTSYIPPTTTTDPIITSSVTSIIATTTTPPPPTTTTDIPYTTTTAADSTTTTTTRINPPPRTTQSTSAIPITTSKDITTSSPVPIVTVTSSGTVVRTYTSTSYSQYVTSVPTVISNIETSPSNSNTGAIVGGVVGGVSFIFIIAIFVFIVKRRRHKEQIEDGNHNGSMNPNPFNHDYHSYGSPTVLPDPSTNRPVSIGSKPRPFVQAYEEQPHYAGYDGSQSPNHYTYPHDTAYYAQHEPMISNYSLTDYGRNVPHENDFYEPARRESRHVPNERPSVPHTK